MSLEICRSPRCIEEFWKELDPNCEICIKGYLFSLSFLIMNVSPFMPFPVELHSCINSEIVFENVIHLIRLGGHVWKHSDTSKFEIFQQEAKSIIFFVAFLKLHFLKELIRVIHHLLRNVHDWTLRSKFIKRKPHIDCLRIIIRVVIYQTDVRINYWLESKST